MTKGTIAAPESLKTTLMIQSKHDMARYPSIQQKPPIYDRKTFGIECDEADVRRENDIATQLDNTLYNKISRPDCPPTNGGRSGRFFAPANSLRCHAKVKYQKIITSGKNVTIRAD